MSTPETSASGIPVQESVQNRDVDYYAAKAASLVEQDDPVAYAEAYLETAQILNRAAITEETVEAALANAEAVKPTARIAIRMQEANFRTMTEGDGNYKTVYETGMTKEMERERGSDYIRRRSEVEERHGISNDGEEPHMVYGYLDNLLTVNEVTPATQYGKVALYLKPEVMKRATFTFDDSFRTTAAGDHEVATAHRKMDSDTAIVAKELNDIARYGAEEHTPYVEAQIFGGVTMEDVEAVSITLESGAGDSLGDLEMSLTALKEKYPDIALTIRVPAAAPVGYKIVDMADRFPDVTFALCVDTNEVRASDGGYGRPLPYEAMRRATTQSPQSSHTKLSDSMRTEIRQDARRVYHKAQERVKELDQKYRNYWEESTNSTELPTNLSILVTGTSRIN